MLRWRLALSTFLLLFSFQVYAATESYNFLQWKRQRDWYEWWYYKVNIPKTDKAFYFFYGVVNPADTKQLRPASKSYVAFGSIHDLVHQENRFRVSDFTASHHSAQVKIADNEANAESLRGKVYDDDGKELATWDLKMDLKWSFNAMGWGLFVPYISNIFWFPAQASATMSGTIQYKGEVFHLDHAPSYQDRNWGRSFPKWWAWIAANSFENAPDSALVLGGGLPGILGHLFLKSGLSIGLHHRGKEYKFRTTDADRVRFDIHFGKWEISAENRNGQRLLISAFAPKEKFIPIPLMSPQGREFIDYEALKADLKVQLFKKNSQNRFWVLDAELRSQEAGLEFGSFDTQSINIENFRFSNF